MGAGKGKGGAGCVCYWGCGNIGNQIVWGTFIISACLGAGLIIGGAVGGTNCFKDFQNCVDDGGSRDFCQTLYNKVCNLNRYQGLLGAGIIIFFLITPLITSYFCCCASRPLAPGQEGQGMVVISSTAVPPMHDPNYPPPGAYPYPYPPGPPGAYGQPGAPPPYYPPPQQYPPMAGHPGPSDPNAQQQPTMGVPVPPPKY